MIVCGWCGVPTKGDPCGNCHRDPVLPYTHRAQEPTTYDKSDVNRLRLVEATRTLGRDATVEQIAELLDVHPRTVTRWRAVSE